MNTIKRNITALLAMTMLVSLTSFSVKALEINDPMFSGTVNSTVTSGFSWRSSERNCMLQAGESYNAASGTHVLNSTGLGTAAAAAAAKGTTATNLLTGGTKNYEFSNVCSIRRTDAYGNTSTNPLDLGSQNTDDGNLNYRDGEIIDATQKVFTEIDGSLPNGTGLTLSFIANYNPVDSISGANFINLTNAAKDDLESDFTLLNAYVTSGFEAGDLGYIDVTLGRHVTSWGEATFIPVGANGLVTNALDLTALRAPGASIRDALLPTEQITFQGALADNLGFEFYYQFSNDSIELDPKGSFFGSELAGVGGDRILASGGYTNEEQGPVYCTYGYNVALGNACDADSKAYHLAAATRGNFDTEAILERAFKNATLTDWGTWTALGRTGDHGQLLTNQGLLVNNTLENFTTSVANLSGLNTIYTDNVAAASFDVAASVQLMVNEQKFVESKDDGQYGIRLNTYLDNVGTGLDVNIYYANYHSKVPYLQIVGEGGVLAGDIMGAFNYALADYQGGILDPADPQGFMTAGQGASASQLLMQQALLEGAWGSGLCAGLGATLGAAAFAPDGTASFEQKEAYKNIIHRVMIDGELVHDPSTCLPTYGVSSMGTILGVTPAIAGAVYPLNQATYRFIYPEDNKIMGASFNTNVGPTTVQAEISYRPDFPLATNAGDQINQIADAAGVSAALTAFAHDTYGLTPANATNGVVIPNLIDTVAGSGTFESLLKNVRRSSLPFISDTGSATADYYSSAFINYDVLSLDVGTTTSFSASHPITKSLGADSAVLLTELAVVQIQDLDNMGKGFVARGGAGFNEGAGEHLCLGIFQGLTSAQLTQINAAIGAQPTAGADWLIDYDLGTGAGVTNVGAGIVDAVFGNGSYCEGQMGADDRSYSYRVVGSATYNNFANSPWSLSPNFAWSSDPKGYGPASLGGFSEGRSSLSLGVTARNDAVSASLSYVDQMGDDLENTRNDMDFMSASVSYSF